MIIRNYSDIPLAGGMRDEWGFPPNFTRDKVIENQFWYSKHYASAYAEKTGGRELLADLLLMYMGIKGQESERRMAINYYMEMNRQRNAALENDFYQTVKEVFGPDAAVVTHATWYPYPDRREYKKNGLDWWVTKRDWAQTDELTPFAVRTALSKKWDSPVWYNQYLIDGTFIRLAGTNDAAGDTIKSRMKIGKFDVAFDAIGVAAIRLDENGRVQALAAGGLKSFKTNDFFIQLDKRVDLAFRKNDGGEFEGVIQALEGEIPRQLPDLICYLPIQTLNN